MNYVDKTYLSTLGADPYSYYQSLLGKGAVQWDPTLAAWLVSSYEGYKEVLRDDDKLFVMPERTGAHREELASVQGGQRTMALLMGSDHDKMHRWWLSIFSARQVEEWRSTLIRPIVHGALDRIVSRGKADLVEDFAHQVPIRVIAALMDLPWKDDQWVTECRELNERVLELFARRLGRTQDGSTTEHKEVLEASKAASDRLDALLVPHVRDRENSTGPDLISRLWREGKPLFEDWGFGDVVAGVRLMFQAGSHTTAFAISSAAYLLLKHPELRSSLADESPKLENFVEEVLRLHGPVHFRTRKALDDVTIAGCPIMKDQQIFPVTAAANRDPAHYAHPDEVDLARQRPRDHFAFNYGPRVCVGAALARAEILEATKAMLQRLPELRFDADAPSAKMTGWLNRLYQPLNVHFAATSPGREAVS